MYNIIEANLTILNLQYSIYSDGLLAQIQYQNLHAIIHQNYIYIVLHNIYVKTYVADNYMNIKYTVEKQLIIALSIPKCDPISPIKSYYLPI